MNKIEKQETFKRAEKKLQSLIDQLENRLKTIDQATVEARQIRKELEKLKDKS